MAVEAQRRGGRRSKGDRRYFGTRVAMPVAEKLEEAAKASGLSISDFIAVAVEKSLGSIDVSQIDHQQELPIGRMAS